ncbi:hypothetical protein DY000_02039899 [Brassica cretica]|uniref:Uncharacterized protein n=1 Tax=Brassica cretica TaxID=69181 RepID=A0ABQ7BH28_BRACR|nr:hypothetical protein DY000_02039899 [Brassica cretica]
MSFEVSGTLERNLTLASDLHHAQMLRPPLQKSSRFQAPSSPKIPLKPRASSSLTRISGSRGYR